MVLKNRNIFYIKNVALYTKISDIIIMLEYLFNFMDMHFFCKVKENYIQKIHPIYYLRNQPASLIIYATLSILYEYYEIIKISVCYYFTKKKFLLTLNWLCGFYNT